MSALKIVSDGSTNWPPSLPKSQPTSKMAAATKKRNLFKLKQDELKLQFYANELFDIFGVFHEICNFDNFLLRMQIRPIFFFYQIFIWKSSLKTLEQYDSNLTWVIIMVCIWWSCQPINMATFAGNSEHWQFLTFFVHCLCKSDERYRSLRTCGLSFNGYTSYINL